LVEYNALSFDGRMVEGKNIFSNCAH